MPRDEGSTIISDKRIVVIGAGIGGLAAAIDLARQGMHVTVLERATQPGGKVRTIAVGGNTIDAGPTVLTMRWVFDALFADAGATLSDHLTLHPAATLARHAWAETERLDLYADRQQSADAIATLAGPRDAANYLALCRDAERMYRVLEEPFLKSPRPRRGSDLVNDVGTIGYFRLKPFKTLWSTLSAQMQDPRLRQLFGHYSTSLGTSPFSAPAALMIAAHIQQSGVWLVEGGMHRLPQALADLATRLGVTIRYESHVADISTMNGRVSGIRLEDEERIPADAVLMNGEPGALGNGLLGRRVKAAGDALKFPQRSLSATTWAAMAEIKGAPLLHENIFFSRDYKQEFDLIDEGRLPTEPTVYLSAQDRPNADASPPAGPERLLMLVNAPPNGDRRAFSQVEIEQCMQGILALLERCGVTMQATEAPVMTTPAIFNRLFPASGGSLYGAATIGTKSPFKRPGNRTKVPGLYLAGGSTHPGPGVPLAALSGRNAAAAIAEDLAPPRRGLLRLFRKRPTT